MNSIALTILCNDLDLAKNYYIEYLGFDEIFDKVVGNENSGFRRVVLQHQLVQGLQVEFKMARSNDEKNKVGKPGGTVGLFSIPSENINKILDKMKNTPSYIGYDEVPYANFLNLKDPMGNRVTLHDIFE